MNICSFIYLLSILIQSEILIYHSKPGQPKKKKFMLGPSKDQILIPFQITLLVNFIIFECHVMSIIINQSIKNCLKLMMQVLHILFVIKSKPWKILQVFSEHGKMVFLLLTFMVDPTMNMREENIILYTPRVSKNYS